MACRVAFFFLALLLMSALGNEAVAQPKPTLAVTGYGGRWSEVMKRALVEPFEKKHNVTIEIVTGITTEWVAKLMAAGPDYPPFDVIVGNEPPLPLPRERGFFDRRNETLAPNIRTVFQLCGLEKLLEQKDVAIAVLHDGSAFDLAKRGLPIGWVAPPEGVPILDQVAQVTRGSKHKDLAWKLVNGYLSPEVQPAFATDLFFSPTNRSVKLPHDVAGKIISGPKDVERFLIFDWSQIAQQRSAWTERWNKEIR